MLECAVDFFVVVVFNGPSTPSLANQAPVYCGCPAGTHGSDLVSRVSVRGLFSAIVPDSSSAEVRMGLLIEPTHMEDEDEEQENEKEDGRDGEEQKGESK